MSELPDLGRVRRPGSAPRPEVLQAIVDQGRRRLRRTALSGAGALATVTAAVVGAALLGSGAGDALVVVPASPFPGVAASPSPSGPAPQRDPSPGAPEPAASGARPVPEPQPPIGPGSSSGPGSVPEPRPGQSLDPGRPLPEHREQPERVPYADLCQGSAVTWAPEGYRMCMRVRMPTSVPQGTPVDIELDLCSSIASRGTLRLSFRNGREHDIQVRRKDEPDSYLWTWSAHHRFPQGPHQLDLEAGYCLRWVTPWDTRDDGGRLLAPGEYAVEGAVAAEGATQWTQQPFRLTGQ